MKTIGRVSRLCSNPAHQQQYDEDDDDDADDTDAAVTVAVAVAAKAATEAAEQEDDQNDDEYQPDRHDLSPVWRLFAFERVLQAADGVLNLAGYLFGLAVRLQLGVADRLAGDLLDRAFEFLRRSGDSVLVHGDFLQMTAFERGAL